MQRVFLFLACFFIVCADSIAQQYPFVFYTPKNGLVNSRVRKMYQDSRGRLYFITYGGLSVYDGARFRNYTSLNGLGSDMVNDVVEVGQDSLLIAPNGIKMNILVNGQLKDFKPDNNFNPTVNQFLKSNDGNIYVTADEGFFVLKKNRFEDLTFLMPGSPAVLPFLGTIVEAGDMFLIGTNDLRNFVGLYLYDKKNKKITDAMTDTHITSFSKDKKGRVWISVNNKVYLIDSVSLKNGKIQLAPLPAPYSKLSDLFAFAFTFDDHGVWIIHSQKEIFRAGDDGSLSHINIPGERGHGGTDRIFVDKEKILWICSMGAGAFKLVNTSLQINETLPGNNGTDIINDAFFTNDTTWYIVNSGRLVRQTSAGMQTFATNVPDPVIGSWQQNGGLMLCTARDLYSASPPSATDKKVNARKFLTLPDRSYGGLLVADPYGNRIVTESNHISVIRNDSIIFRYPLSTTDLVQSLKFDKQNRLWVAGRFTGLLVFALHPENPSNYLQLIHDFKKHLGETATPRSMILDKKGNVWVGTRYDGLMGFTYENNDLKKFLHLQSKDGLTDNFITSLGCDSSNMILVGTQTGLDRLVPTIDSGYRIENITKSNGIFGYVNNIWVDSRNESHALINNGSILHVSPSLASKGVYEPDLFIEEIKVNGISINPSAQDVKLSYIQRNLSFNVAAPAFVDEQQVKYSYLLEGSGNHEWSDASSNAGINFLNLPPGEYTLRVKALFPSTSYLPQQLSYSFVIVPPWWQTTWFRIIVGILPIIVLALILRFYYARKLEKQKTILEKQQAVEKERTRIATDMHDDLGAGLSRIKFLSETIGIKKQQQQPIEEDISKIRQYSHDMIDKMGEIVWALNKDNDTLSDLLSYTRAYAVEYLSQNGIQCVVEAPDQFPSQTVGGDFRRNIYLTVKEALHNIVKHSQANRVNIYMMTDNNLMLTIQDNGTGFDEKNIRPFSNGLNNMKKRMESVGGKLEIKNEAGTSVVLTVPMN